MVTIDNINDLSSLDEVMAVCKKKFKEIDEASYGFKTSA